MATTKERVSLSLDRTVAAQVRSAAADAGLSISAWMERLAKREIAQQLFRN